jgi:secretion/DNA translocation related TadE-like protein
MRQRIGRGGAAVVEHGAARHASMPPPDRGGATIWTIAAGALVVLVALGAAAVAAAVVARHRAQAAADLAALAGAAVAIEGDLPTCARAAEFAAHNGARLVGCRLDGADVTVAVAVVPPELIDFGLAATAAARAGPVEAPPSALPGD